MPMNNATHEASRHVTKLRGYNLLRPDVSGGTWMFCGTTVNEVLEVIRAELEMDMEAGAERSQIVLEPIEITQAEIDTMPEFPGW